MNTENTTMPTAILTACTYSQSGRNTIPFSSLADGLHYICGFGNGEKLGVQFFTSTAVCVPTGYVEWFPYYGEEIRYATWTDKQRKTEAKRIADEKKRAAKEALAIVREHNALVRSAKSKLTKKEYSAVYDEGYQDGRY